MDATLALGQFATLTGAAAIIVALVEVIKRTLAWSDQLTERFAPLTSIILGIIVMVLVTLGTVAPETVNWIEPIFAGLVTGLYACGLYSLGGKPIITTVAGPANGTH